MNSMLSRTALDIIEINCKGMIGDINVTGATCWEPFLDFAGKYNTESKLVASQTGAEIGVWTEIEYCSFTCVFVCPCKKGWQHLLPWGFRKCKYKLASWCLKGFHHQKQICWAKGWKSNSFIPPEFTIIPWPEFQSFWDRVLFNHHSQWGRDFQCYAKISMDLGVAPP